MYSTTRIVHVGHPFSSPANHARTTTRPGSSACADSVAPVRRDRPRLFRGRRAGSAASCDERATQRCTHPVITVNPSTTPTPHTRPLGTAGPARSSSPLACWTGRCSRDRPRSGLRPIQPRIAPGPGSGWTRSPGYRADAFRASNDPGPDMRRSSGRRGDASPQSRPPTRTRSTSIPLAGTPVGSPPG
jgi:hypothetical protein